MTNSQSNNTQNKDYIANLGQGINSGIIGITTFVERYQTMLANNIKPSAEEYQKIGKYLYNSALDGLQSAKNLVEKSSLPNAHPQAKRVAQDILAVEKRIAKSLAEGGSEAYAKAAKSFHQVMEATRNAKVAGMAGVAVTITDVTTKTNKAVETGDYSEVGQALSGFVGSMAGANIGIAVMTAILAGAGITASAPFAMVFIAGFAMVGAVGGDLVGQEMWKRFSDDASNWLSDKFSSWFEMNRDGFHTFYDPLILDLDGNGISTFALNSNDFKQNAFFDFDNDGISHATGWTTDGFLVRDINKDGVINNGSEVFGDHTLKQDGTKAKHGFDALSDLDSNHDGKIDKQDLLFKELKVWQDSNKNGISEQQELKTLDEFNIDSLNLNYHEPNQTLQGGRLSQLATYTKTDGSTHQMGDVDFNFSHTFSQYANRLDTSKIGSMMDLARYVA